MYAEWEENTLYLDWRAVFHHPRSALVYTIVVGSRSGYTDMLYNMDEVVTNTVVDIDSSVTSAYVVIKATADNGQFVLYNTFESRK